MLNITVIWRVVVWEIMLCSPLVTKWCFGGTCHLHVQGWRIGQERNQHEASSKNPATCFILISCLAYSLEDNAAAIYILVSYWLISLHGRWGVENRALPYKLYKFSMPVTKQSFARYSLYLISFTTTRKFSACNCIYFLWFYFQWHVGTLCSESETVNYSQVSVLSHIFQETGSPYL
jgi:hypothetical protein